MSGVRAGIEKETARIEKETAKIGTETAKKEIETARIETKTAETETAKIEKETAKIEKEAAKKEVLMGVRRGRFLVEATNQTVLRFLFPGLLLLRLLLLRLLLLRLLSIRCCLNCDANPKRCKSPSRIPTFNPKKLRWVPHLGGQKWPLFRD